MEIIVTRLEYMFAAHAGFFRQVTNVLNERQDAHGFEGDGYKIHVEGSAGEFFVSIALDRCWRGPGTLRGPDVGKRIQARYRAETGAKLRIHPTDDDGAPFVLVTGIFPKFDVSWWLYGREGKEQKWWSDPTGKNRYAYFVPQEVLRPIEDLKLLLLKADLAELERPMREPVR